jgi:hypothetical protein
MLDTVLQIGRTLRDPENRAKGLKHHRYVQQCPSGEDENVLRLRIPVSETFEIDFDGITVLDDENVFDKLFYLKYKSADADSFTKYIFGDIYFELNRGDEGGYYRLANPEKNHALWKLSSFGRGQSDAQEIIALQNETSSDREDSVIDGFQKSLVQPVNREQTNQEETVRCIDLIERLLKYQSGISLLLEDDENIVTRKLLQNERKLRLATAKRTFGEIDNSRSSKQRFRGALGETEPEWEEIKESEEAITGLVNYASGQVFLHFDIAGKHWYEFEPAMAAIDRQFTSKFAASFSQGDFNGSVLQKYIYKTIYPGRQVPDFDPNNQHRIKLFDEEELMSLFYAIDTAKKAKFRTSQVKLVVLPKGENMTASDITQFMEGVGSLQEAAEQEQELKGEVKARGKQLETSDSLFTAILEDTTDNIVQFDLVFSEADSRGQDADLVELSGVSKGFLQKVHRRVKSIKSDLFAEWDKQFENPLDGLNIQRAFWDLLSDLGQDKSKYEQHLYQVLPKIYTETYYRDPVLLPALIERTERDIRGDGISKRRYNQRKFDFYLLTKIQNTPTEEENLMRILNSPSYKLGLPLGVMARPLRSRINSFEKNYVGNLRRRIATLDDLIEFKNDVEEMLVRHEASRMTSVDEARQELVGAIETFEDGGRLDKNRCALGFFETYFEPYSEDSEDDERS